MADIVRFDFEGRALKVMRDELWLLAVDCHDERGDNFDAYWRKPHDRFQDQVSKICGRSLLG
jgi:hypothetical protein